MQPTSRLPRRRPLTPRDLQFNRVVAIVALLVGAVFVYSLAFTSFDEKVRFQWDVEADGGRTPRTHITCPSPWAVLVHDAEPEIATTPGFCVMPSRALSVEAAGVGLLSLAVAGWLLSRRTRPGELPPLPERLKERSRLRR